MKYRIILSLVLSLFITTGAIASTDWQLPAGYYIPAKMVMTVVHPRPDTETNTWARHRKAYADGTVQYRIPVSIQGGAYPFKYELINGPAGMAVGATVADQNYGIVTWTPGSTGGPYTVSVKITDQEQNTVTANWSITATTAGFIFVDPKVATPGTGTKNSPLKTFADIHKGSSNDSTYSGKIVYLREGTHNLTGAANKGNLQLANNNKPAVWLGYPGETVIVNAKQSKVLVNNQNDVFVSGFRMTQARNDVNNAHFWFFSATSAQKRLTFFEMDFDNIGRGLTGSDNPAAITFFNPGKMREYFTLVNSSLKDYSSPFVDLYASRYGVIENNRIYKGKSASINQGIFLKSDIQNYSVRRNTSLNQTFTYGAIEVMMQAQLFKNNNIEIIYNLLNNQSTSSAKRSIVFNWQSSGGANSNPRIYVYRNTIIGNVQGLDYFKYMVDFENNVLVSSSGLVKSGSKRIINNIDNATGGINTNLTNSDGVLIGATGSKYRGTHGHEISIGSNPPLWPNFL